MSRSIRGMAVFAFLVALGAAEPAAAQDRAPLLEALAGCREIAEPVSRLACYDEAARAMDEAERQGEIVVLDSARVERTRREAFGFHLPSLTGFTGRTDEPDIETIHTTLVRASSGPDRKWLFYLADGSVWRQIDNARALFRNREDVEVRIRQGAVGSYLLFIDGTPGVRVRREQ